MSFFIPPGPLITSDSINSSNKSSFANSLSTLIIPTYSSTDDIIKPIVGMLIYNNTTEKLEVYNGTTWDIIASGDSGLWTQQGPRLVPTSMNLLGGGSFSVAISADGNTLACGAYNDDSDTGAVWVFTRTADVWSQEAGPLVGTGGIGVPQQGYSLALSDDGNTMAVGGPRDDNYIGAVWIWTRSAGLWTQQGSKLVANDGAGLEIFQGNSVSLSGDGNTLAVGAPYDDDVNYIGAAWVWTRTAGVWTQQGSKIIGTGYVGTDIEFGDTVSLSQDGDTLAVGGGGDDNYIGATWIFTRTASVWTQQGSKLVGSGAIGSSYQAYVSLSQDGNTLAVGGPDDDNNIGATWIFTRMAGVWTQFGSKIVVNRTEPQQGTSISISSDGDTLAVGGQVDNGNIGATWIFTRTAGVWTQQGSKLVGTGAVGNAQQGISVSLSQDGDTLAVGGESDNGNIGATWIFTRTAGVWTQQGSKLVGTGAVGNAQQGNSVSLSQDGDTLAIGGPQDNSGIGAIWIFTRTAGVWTQQSSKLVGTGAVGISVQGESVSLSHDGDTLAVGGPVDNGSIGATWIFTRTAGVWTQQGSKLVGTGAVGNAQQGISVSLSQDGDTLAVGGYLDDGTKGATWIFTRTAGVWSQQGSKLVGTGAIDNARQGSAVSLKGDTLVVGGPYDDPIGASYIGATWVWTRTAGVWTQQGSKLVGTGSSGINIKEGTSVSLSQDGNTLITGGPYDDVFIGATWAFTRTAGVWTQQGTKLVGTGSTGSLPIGFGSWISLKGDTVLISSYIYGLVFVFVKNAGNWILFQTINSSVIDVKVALNNDQNTFVIGGDLSVPTLRGAFVYIK